MKSNNTGIARRISWLFKSGVLWLGLEHFLAMFPATILVPLLINNHFGASVIDVALVLFTSGIGTIAFIFFSKGKIPTYLGSSFAFIGLTIYMISSQTNPDITPQMAYSYVGWAYLFSGFLLLLLSFIYRFKAIGKILTFILPAPIVGPAISLIGLELADTAALDSGFQVSTGTVNSSSVIIAITTLTVIILMSVIRHKKFKNAAIMVGMIAGYAVAMMVSGIPSIDFSQVQIIKPPVISFPFLNFPPNMIGLFVAVIPATFIVFTENIGRITIITRMTNGNSENQTLFNSSNLPLFGRSVFCHGIATTIAGALGSVPNTLYAENIAVMGIHSTDIYEQQRLKKEKDGFIKQLCEPYSYIPFVVAAFYAICVSFLGVLQTVLLSVPKPVIGGIELFLFGIISAPGIQLLVEQKVNYKKISNQLLTASVLITGISGLTVNFGVVELKGMSLGFVVGVILNLIIIFISWTGRLNDSLSFDEIFILCVRNLKKDKIITAMGSTSESLQTASFGTIEETNEDNINENILLNGLSLESTLEILNSPTSHILINDKNISADFIKDAIKNCTYTFIGNNIERKEIIILKTTNSQYIFIDKRVLDEDSTITYMNDYRDYIDTDTQGYIRIPVNGDVPIRIIRKILLSVN